MAKAHIERINAIAELDRLGVKWEHHGDEEIQIVCPVHDDNSPSVGLNTKTNLWRCRASHCNAKGDVVRLLAYITKLERSALITELSARYNLEQVKTFDPAQIERWHTSLIESKGNLYDELVKRGISETMMRKLRLGIQKDKITIPVYNANKEIINVRKYLPGAPGHLKMRNMPGYGKINIYLIEQIDKYDTIWICGGELKAAVVAELLNPLGIGAISATAGEGSWDVRWTKLLHGKKIFLCMDADVAGKTAARKIGELIYQQVPELGIINLPLDKTKYPKGDVNDYVGQERATSKDLISCMDGADEFQSAKDVQQDQLETFNISLNDATDPQYIGRRIKFEGTSIASDDEPYYAPKKVRVHCDRAQGRCGECPLYGIDHDGRGYVDIEVNESSKGMLNFINLPDAKVADATRNLLGVPRCKSFFSRHLEKVRVHDVRLQPQISIGNTASEYATQAAFVLGEDPELNVVHDFTGVLWENPKNQKAVLLLTDAEETSDNLSSFKITDDDFKKLKMFQPEEWTAEAVGKKLTDIYCDFSANVTRIYQRKDLHFIVDLSYHSPLLFQFDGRDVTGWINTLIIGDTAQGKSEVSKRLMEFYRLGEKAECKNSSVAGLIGGLQQLGSRWFVSWGILPRHDRRLVVLEEVKGTGIETIAKLTDTRSSGVAQLDKIEQRRASARTRLIFISNPRSERMMRDYTYGIEAIPELIGAPEDIRRFDACLVVDSREIDENTLKTETYDHTYEADLCRKLILWSWTLGQDEVRFEPEALEYLEHARTELIKTFDDFIPIVDKATTGLKLARLSASLAARTFSEEGGVLVVRKCHVEVIHKWLNRIYSNPTMGYAEFSKRRRSANQMRDPGVVTQTINQCKHARDFVQSLLFSDQITEDDIGTWTETSREDSRAILSALVRKNALVRTKFTRRSYIKTEGFIELLRKLEHSLVNHNVIEDNERF